MTIIPTILTEIAKERSTYVITVAPTDETGAAVTPTTLAWSLRDTFGNVINSRSSVSLTPATSMKVVLHGADLAVGTYGNERKLTLSGTYTSSLGSGLEITGEVTFYIEPFVGVTD